MGAATLRERFAIQAEAIAEGRNLVRREQHLRVRQTDRPDDIGMQRLCRLGAIAYLRLE